MVAAAPRLVLGFAKLYFRPFNYSPLYLLPVYFSYLSVYPVEGLG